MTAAAAGYVTDVTYTSGFYPNLAPGAICHAAALNRVVPPKLTDGFRYLELGCGLGRTLTTLAAANPAGEFVGVDINPEHTASIDRDIAAGGLGNVRTINADFASLPSDIGTFEFVTLHGVLSWVAPQVREQILTIARTRLAPGGLLLVSYNAMPGWAHLQPIRGILRQYAMLRQGDSAEKVRAALAYLVFIRDRRAKYFQDNPGAAAYVDNLLKQDPRYLVHEYLNEHWTSFYFADVAAMFGTAGLAFVGSLPVHTNFWDLCVRPEFQELFRTTNNRLVTEAHKDFCANTAFRSDVYAKSPRLMPGVADRVREADDLCFRVSRPGITLPYQANLGVVTSTVQGPLYQSLLDILGDESLRLSQILASPAVQHVQPVEAVRAVDAGVALGIFDISTGPLPPAIRAPLGDLKLTGSFNRAMLERYSLGGQLVALASESTGTGHTLGDFDAAILHELVERGRNGLVGRVEARLVGSGRTLQQQGRMVSEPATRSKLVAEAVEAFLTNVLPKLARIGIVEPAG